MGVEFIERVTCQLVNTGPLVGVSLIEALADEECLTNLMLVVGKFEDLVLEE